MEWLNYHHLLYFWMVAREGTIARAGAALGLTQPTISGQLRLLEEAIGEKLFSRKGRTLELTETGQMVYRYADEIFGIGRELQDALRGRPSGRAMVLHAGISDALPKIVAYRLLEPALRMEEGVRLVCTEDKTERLLGELATRGLDLVLTDTPISGKVRVKAFNHLLGESGVTFFASPKVASAHERKFPGCLDAAPMLLPTESTALRRQLDRWFAECSIAPRVVSEFDDSALMKMFGERGEGIFPAPTVIEKDIREHYGVAVVGRTEEIREQFYAITVERRIKHPAVQRIREAAQGKLFAA